MRHFTLRLCLAIITFIIGIAATSIWFFNFYLRIEESDVPMVNLSTSENIISQESQALNDIEDYRVYSAILADNRYNSELIVISDYTSHDLISSGADLNREMFSLTQDAINNYQERNKERQNLKDKFTVNKKVVLITEREEKQLFFSGFDGWNKFYKKYPKSSGIIILSNVGFNQSRTQAIVSVSIQCGGLCGEGEFIILKKAKGMWIIQERAELWVS